MTTKTLKIAGLAVGGLAVLGLFFPVGSPATTTVIEKIVPGDQNFGASPGPDNPGFTYWSVNGLASHYRYIAGQTGTTTPCNIAAPTGSTTLSHFVFHQKTATTVATRVTIARASTINATTTIIGNQFTIPASQPSAVIIASTTPVGGVVHNLEFNTGDFLVVGVQGGASAGGANLFTGTATCGAVFMGS